MKNPIDFSESLKLVNHDEGLANDLLTMLIKDLPSVKKTLLFAIDQHDLLTCRKVIHKTLGAICYCGVPNLKEHLLIFQNEHRNGSSIQKLSQRIDEIVIEMDHVISAYNEIYADTE
jgi:two-component system, NarL family, sensor histidine kinase BarA